MALGENEFVALSKGAVQEASWVLELRFWRKVVHPDEMPEGMAPEDPAFTAAPLALDVAVYGCRVVVRC